MEIIFKRTSQRIKKPKHLARNVFILYSPKRVLVETPDAAKIDTEIIGGQIGGLQSRYLQHLNF